MSAFVDKILTYVLVKPAGAICFWFHLSKHWNQDPTKHTRSSGKGLTGFWFHLFEEKVMTQCVLIPVEELAKLNQAREALWRLADELERYLPVPYNHQLISAILPITSPIWTFCFTKWTKIEWTDDDMGPEVKVITHLEQCFPGETNESA